MAVVKTLGIETEFGIVQRGVEESNPISASSMLINAYLAQLQADRDGTHRVNWDFNDESPALDARGFAPLGARPPEIETHLVNAVLTNGARYYVDHAHPELSTPECADARAIVVFDRAAEEILVQSMAAANALLPPDQELVVYKNNSDGKGNSYGCHENYLVDRLTPFGDIVHHLTPHFITRQIFTGAGKVGTEFPGMNRDEIGFQLTQRADFFEEEVGLETTLKRPIINTRDEPHADAQKYRRLHVIVGDANLCEVATYLKVGTTAIILAMIEEGFIDRDLRFAQPVLALRDVSWDLSMSDTILFKDGTSATALEVQWYLLERSRAFCEQFGTDLVGGEVALDVLVRWEQILHGLETDPMSLSGQLDWVAKYRLLNAYRERDNMDWSDARLLAMDIQYHDMRPNRSLFAKLSTEKLVTADEVSAAKVQPPLNTRAYFRGQCLAKWPENIVAANWDSLVFDIGRDPLRRVPMMEPTRGTYDHVGTLLEECETAAELIERLGA